MNFCPLCRFYVGQEHVCGRTESSLPAFRRLPRSRPSTLRCKACRKKSLCLECPGCGGSFCLRDCWETHVSGHRQESRRRPKMTEGRKLKAKGSRP